MSAYGDKSGYWVTNGAAIALPAGCNIFRYEFEKI